METAQQMYDRAFGPAREMRSGAYKLGVLHLLQSRVDGLALLPCPYDAGTAMADAYLSGQVEGSSLAEQHVTGIADPP
jgi:hypothetical protein